MTGASSRRPPQDKNRPSARVGAASRLTTLLIGGNKSASTALDNKSKTTQKRGTKAKTVPPSTRNNKAASVTFVAPGDLICRSTENTSLLKGIGITEQVATGLAGETTTSASKNKTELRAAACGKLKQVSQLIFVETDRHFALTVGDVVVGRIVSVLNGKWAVDVGQPRLATLPLAAIHLPNNEQRRRTAEDLLNIRDFFKENDLIVAEVQRILQPDSSSTAGSQQEQIFLQTRSAKYGLLRNGIAVDLLGRNFSNTGCSSSSTTSSQLSRKNPNLLYGSDILGKSRIVNVRCKVRNSSCDELVLRSTASSCGAVEKNHTPRTETSTTASLQLIFGANGVVFVGASPWHGVQQRGEAGGDDSLHLAIDTLNFSSHARNADTTDAAAAGGVTSKHRTALSRTCLQAIALYRKALEEISTQASSSSCANGRNVGMEGEKISLKRLEERVEEIQRQG
ncbi:unnamed protein product [Amoebophrya sp. A120]|nr:unnamed protein product [Amoebophrya sp. A120]|eukprot:GSA120T00020753001.1